MELKEAKIANFYNLTFGTELGVEKALVRIPHYQRPYRWPTEYINTLINDWHNEKSGKYFTGSIVTVRSSDGIVHQLIDGQQRFTTVFLINYVCFLIIRVAIREAILYRRSRVSGLLDSLLNSVTYLYEKNDANQFEALKETILEKIDSLDEAKTEEEESEILSSLTEVFSKYSYLPIMSEGKSEYKYSYKKLLENSFDEKSIKLSYDRAAFSTQLKSSLINCLVKLDSQNEQIIEFVENDDNPVAKQYRNSIETIFNHFTKLSENTGDEPLLKAINTIKLIEKFLKEVNFCVIQTGSVNDAYTLFEVLNDRALSLDDLDLIKNQFYKKFCLSNNTLSDKEIDKIIEQREIQWGEAIFPDDLKIAHKPLITYIFSSYYSGETDYLLQSNEKNRLKITNHLEQLSSYHSNEFLKDFNAFEACTTFVNLFDIWHKSKNKKALKAEYSINSSPTYKLIHLLSALGQFGVLVGVTNVIFKYIEINISKQFEPSKVKAFFEELKTQEEKHVELHKLSTRVWQLSMQAPSAELPREYAAKLIKANNVNSTDIDFHEVDFITKKLKDELNTWLDNWRYNKNDIKVCLLFARLIKSSSKELKENNFKTSLSNSDVEKLHLDHMEPSSVPDHNQKSYFDSEDRQVTVNGLGNMFPLPGNLNISKSNQPLIKVFDYLDKSGLGSHWLVRETKVLFDNHSHNNIPKHDFFLKRKAFLKDKFYQAIVHDFTMR
jgi:uncharacterized protein with ParB-like and HNH nuclease domain